MTINKFTKNKTLTADTNALYNELEKARNVSQARKELDQLNMSEISFGICESIVASVTDKLDDSKALGNHIETHSYQLLDNKKVQEIVEEVLQLKLAN